MVPRVVAGAGDELVLDGGMALGRLGVERLGLRGLGRIWRPGCAAELGWILRAAQGRVNARENSGRFSGRWVSQMRTATELNNSSRR